MVQAATLRCGHAGLTYYCTLRSGSISKLTDYYELSMVSRKANLKRKRYENLTGAGVR